MRRMLVVANWKMHGSRERVTVLIEPLAAAAATFVDALEIIIAPAFPHLSLVHSLLEGSGIGLGAQNMHPQPEGAFTGEVSGAMLADCGVSHVIIGHSERRRLCGERDADVANKFQAAIDGGLTPILCIGESLKQRRQGLTGETVLAQLDAVIAVTGVEAFHDAVIAYEPIWAIGTGETATPGQAQEVHGMVREHLAGHDAAVAEAIRIIYGGSVNGKNAAALFRQRDVDGGLVGGASLRAQEFISICQSAD